MRPDCRSAWGPTARRPITTSTCSRRCAWRASSPKRSAAIRLDHLIGSIEVGKRADLVRVELDTLHNLPRFEREPDSVYSRLVYAAKPTDVSDVMVNGRWLMRDRKLLTVDVEPLLKAAQDYARRIASFLTAREGSLLAK